MVGVGIEYGFTSTCHKNILAARHLTVKVKEMLAEKEAERGLEPETQSGEKIPSPSPLETFLDQIKDAAAQGNLALVADRCEQVRQLCSFGAVKALQPRLKMAESGESKKCGGLTYAPQYILHVVRLADTVKLG